MARTTRPYLFLDSSILNPVRFVPVAPYGVEFTAAGRPAMELGSWFRLDLDLRIRPTKDGDFPVRLAKALGTTIVLRCPQMRGEDHDVGAIATTGAHALGAETIAYSGGSAGATLTPNRIVKFASHEGVYLVLATPAPTHGSFDVHPPLTKPVPSGTSIWHADDDVGLVYNGVLADDLDMSATASESERLEAYRIRLHEVRFSGATVTLPDAYLFGLRIEGDSRLDETDSQELGIAFRSTYDEIAYTWTLDPPIGTLTGDDTRTPTWTVAAGDVARDSNVRVSATIVATGTGTAAADGTSASQTVSRDFRVRNTTPLGTEASISALSIAGPATMIENSSSTFSALASGDWDEIEYAWTLSTTVLGTLSGEDTETSTWEVGEISNDRTVRLTLAATARGTGTVAVAGTTATQTATLDVSVSNVPTDSDPFPPDSVLLSIAADGTATVTPTWPTNDNPLAPRDGWGAVVGTESGRPWETVLSEGNIAVDTASHSFSTPLNEAGTYYAWVRARSGGMRSTWTESPAVDFSP